MKKALFTLWLALICLAPLRGQGIDVIKVQNNGTAAGTIAGPFTLNCTGTGSPCTITNGPKTLAIASGSGSSITLQTNGTNNASQTSLNLVAGTNVTLTNTSGGNVTIAATGGGGGRTVVFSALNKTDTVTTTGAPFATIFTFAAGTMCPTVGTVYDIVISGTFSLSSGTPAFDLGIALTRVLQNQAVGTGGATGSWTAFEHITCAQIGASGVLIGDGHNYVRGASGDFSNTAEAPIAFAMNQNFTSSVQITPLAQFSGSGSMTLVNFVIFQTN